jgi:hypothetical protein
LEVVVEENEDCVDTLTTVESLMRCNEDLIVIWGQNRERIPPNFGGVYGFFKRCEVSQYTRNLARSIE